MNIFDARARHNGYIWIGEFRAGEHGEYKPVMENGEVRPFQTAREAREAAQASLIAYMNGKYTSTARRPNIGGKRRPCFDRARSPSPWRLDDRSARHSIVPGV